MAGVGSAPPKAQETSADLPNEKNRKIEPRLAISIIHVEVVTLAKVGT